MSPRARVRCRLSLRAACPRGRRLNGGFDVLENAISPALVQLSRDVLDISEKQFRVDSQESFAALGGTSLRAMRLVARAERELGLRIDLADLLRPGPLTAALRRGGPLDRAEHRDRPASDRRPLLPAQHAMLVHEQQWPGTGYRLLFSLRCPGPARARHLRDCLDALTARHETLRTVFDADGDQPGRRVLRRWRPVLREQGRVTPGGDPVDVAHAHLADLAPGLDPFRRPAAEWLLTELPGDESHVVSLLAHHALLDGWAVGLVLRELAAAYLGGTVPPAEPGVPPDVLLRSARPDDHLRRRRAAQLAGAPQVVELPGRPAATDRPGRPGSRLTFTLGPEAAEACGDLARGAAVSRTAVLLAAWALVAARRCGVDDLLVGVPAAGRPTAELSEMVGLATRVVPVRCRWDDDAPAGTLAPAVADALADAVAAADLPFEALVTELGAAGAIDRNPLVQIGFAAHDELIPAELSGPAGTATVHEGHDGGAVFDAMLYLQAWGERPRFALEHRLAALSPAGAAELAEAFEATLVALAHARDLPLRTVRGMSERQRARLGEWGRGPDAGPGAGLWQAFAEQVCLRPGAVAVRGPEGSTTYAELHDLAERLSAELADAGVTTGSTVVVAAPGTTTEVVAVLATLRLGAAYVGIDADAPDERVATQLARCRPAAVVGDPRVARLAPGVCAVRTGQPRPARTGDTPPAAAPADPQRVACLAFTSGSTGEPKAARITHAAVRRLVHDPDVFRHGPDAGFLRLAPLAFDASTMELFVPLLTGGRVEIFPGPVPHPGELARFLAEREVTVAWLTAGLFRVLADYDPAAFRGLRQLLTGGDVVPARQVAAVLRHCPGLRVTNGYGPTENTVFTTVHHVDDPCELDADVPIGRPVCGTRLLVLDERGELLPPGAVGELCAAGTGLARDYLDDPERTAEAFRRLGDGTRYYRTGDLVRWDEHGRLRFLGRRDQQVKLDGHRVERDEVTHRLLEHPRVSDAAVVVAGDAESGRFLVAALVAPPEAGLVGEVRALAARSLPAYAVPKRWVVLDALPLTANGKVDARAILRLSEEGHAAPPAPTPPGPSTADLESLIAEAWTAVLGDDDFGFDEPFFEVGGDSLQLAKVHRLLRDRLPGRTLVLLDLYRHPTVDSLAAWLRGADRTAAGVTR
ncbi:amino acid adenylation domain-containing protein [Micromonospora sp. WMMD998]|uniref:amino acid adenylation domain-containing protein n=1 Tax=Micromonospora sp. WMMD998 TaxID=3016092 RepID=UPI00249B5F51|nr:amino acid adenylation domain-containing protein [Micromonospora sp. WMMD998]WFE41073.1 amino acid adenylation domain-containing protein [Micromonospora sp. WMMD998]